VLLVLGEHGSDVSSYSPAAVRAYLQRLRIPLVVWTTGKATDALRDAWGAVTEVGTAARIDKATRELRTLLDRQRVAWIEGAFLPQELSVEGATEPQLEDELPLVVGSLEEESEEQERAEREEPPVATEAPPLLTPRSFGPFSGSTDVRDEQLLARLGRLSAALPAAFSLRFGISPAPAGSVFVFGRERDFRAWVRHQYGVDDPRMEGFAASGAAMIYVGNHRGDEAGAMLVHEVTHLLTRAAFGRPVPPWIEEGMAEELAMHRFLRDGQLVPDSIRVTRSTSIQSLSPLARNARVQRSLTGPGAALLRLAGGAIVPLPLLVEVTSEEFLAAEGRQDRYATAAFFIRFLLATQPERAERFRAFLLAGASGASLDRAALEAALQEPIAETDRKFVRWLRQLAMTPR
jgi:hypothetical protein